MPSQHSKKHRHADAPNIVPDPLVDSGNPSHRYQARSTAHLNRPRSRMVALAASPPGPRSPRSPQTEYYNCNASPGLLASDLAWRFVRPAMKCAPEIRGVAEAEGESDFLVRKLRRAQIFQGDLRSKLIQETA